MPFTSVDLSTDIGMVRLLITDMDPDQPIFPDDDMIQTFLTLENDEVKLAAALALETIAANRALTMQVIQLLDLKMDGKSTAEGIRKSAQALRDSAEDDWNGFDIAENPSDSVFAYRDFLVRRIIAESV